MASICTPPCMLLRDVSASTSVTSTIDAQWSECNPRRFLDDDDRLLEFSSFFGQYFESSHPRRDPADTGITQLIPIDKHQQADLFDRVATEFRNHCRSPDDFEILKVELLRNKVLWKRYQAEKTVRRELEAEKYIQRQMARTPSKTATESTHQGEASSRISPTISSSETGNASYQAALKRQQEACSFLGNSGRSGTAVTTHVAPPRTAYFDAVLFHGTKASSLSSILENNLDPRTTTRSNFGRGIYFSDTIEKCMHYVDTQTKFDQVYSILLCCVVLGNVLVNPFEKDQRHMTTDTLFLPPGFDSVCEMSPLKEFVVFEKPQVLPLCVVSIKASNSPSAFWRICQPVLHSYPHELQQAQRTVRVAAPVTEQVIPQVAPSLPRITQPLFSTQATTPRGATSGSLIAAFGAKPLTKIPPLEKLGVKWVDVTAQLDLATLGSLLNLQPLGIKTSTCYLYGILYMLVAGTALWTGQQLIVRILPASYDRMFADAKERRKMEEQEIIDRKARLDLEAATECRLRAEFNKFPSMHQLYPVGKRILMDMDKVKQELAKYPSARQAILDASANQPPHIIQMQLQDLQRHNENLLARQVMFLTEAQKFTLEQQQWIITMVEEEAKLAQLRQSHINTGITANHRMNKLAQEARERASSSMTVMTLDELAILVKIAENSGNAHNVGNNSSAFVFTQNNIPSTNPSMPVTVAAPQTFELRTYNVTCWEAEAWPQMLAEMIMGRVLISKIKPSTFQLLLSQTRKIQPQDLHPQAIQVAGSNGQRFFVAKSGWWYDAPRRHFRIPIAGSRFWPVDPRSRLPSRSFQKLEDYLLWAITKTEKRKTVLARSIETKRQSQFSSARKTQRTTPQETLRRVAQRVQEGMEAVGPSVRFAITGLSAVSGRVVFSRKQMQAFLEQNESNIISSLYVPATAEMIANGAECSVCLAALSVSKATSSSATTSPTSYNRANGVVQLDADSRVVKLKCCRHCFHETCITSWFHAPSAILKCPVCSVSCQPTSRAQHFTQGSDDEEDRSAFDFPKLGPAPDGVMGYIFDPRMCAYYVWFSMPCHDIWDSTTGRTPTRVHITGENRFAIIPFTARLGPMLLIRMIVAFKFGHMFRVGRSLSRNVDNVITWNGIHCRTDLADRNGFGFPQPGYELNAWNELDQKHIAMGLTPLLELFLGPQRESKTRSSSLLTTPSPTTNVITTISTKITNTLGSTAARDDFFDGEDDREVEMEMYDCEYDADEKVEGLGVSSSAKGAHVNSSQHSLFHQSVSDTTQREEGKTYDHWLDPSACYFYTNDETRREFDSMASEHATKIEEAVHLRMDRGMAVDKAIEDVMRCVAGHGEDTGISRRNSDGNRGNGSVPGGDRPQERELLLYKSHQRFFDPRCPLMFG